MSWRCSRSPAKAGVQIRRRTGLRLSPGSIGLLVLCMFALVPASPAFADSLLPAAPYADVQLPDPGQERQARALMETIRCLVCQGQSIADSDAEMAGDMRSLIRERIAAGETPAQIRAWLISRYGDWVTYEPTLQPLTWPLWAAPILLILAGLWLARGRFRRRGRG
jgi:cytochrome c-type biogenesis protein CcmH